MPLICLLSFFSGDAQTALYVDSAVAASGAGTSWAAAYKTLGEALTVANAGGTSVKYDINLAKGTYYPTGVQTGTNRDSAFLILRGGIRLLGGYPSGGGARNAGTNPTVLSGNIGSPAGSADNSFHILVLANAASGSDSILLSGLNFTGGAGDTVNYFNARGISGNSGSAIYITLGGAKAVIHDCNFYDNRVLANGGAIYNINSQLVLAGCTFTSNATTGTNVGAGGGALYSLSNTAGVNNPIMITTCQFNNNTTQFGGGAVYAVAHVKNAGSIRSCSFSGNNAFTGGALYTMVSTADTGFAIDSCIFSGNAAVGINSSGGAVLDYNTNGNRTKYRNCSFTGNSSGGSGGAFYDYAGSNIERCSFTGNHSGQDGGAVFFNCPNTVPPSQIDSCTFTGNRSGGAGGGLYITATANPNASQFYAFVSRCTFLTDTALTSGGGIWTAGNVSVQYSSIRNCRANIGGGMYITSTGLANFIYCFIQGNAAGYNGGGIYAQHVSAGTFIRQSVFSGNFARGNGGALYDSAASPTMAFCTFAGDTAGSRGNAMFNHQSSSPNLSSCIIWAGPGSIFTTLFSNPAISFSTVQGGYPGVGILSADPRFASPVPASAAPTASGNYSLAACSPAIDNADPQYYAFGNDIAGNPRTFGSNADQGAYEYGALAPISGPLRVCVGATAQFASIAAGGVWSSANTAVATISSGGLLTGVASGVVTIIYSVSASSPCAPAMFKIVRVNPLPVINPIVGIPKDSLCAGGATISLSGNGFSGTWTTRNPLLGTVYPGSAGSLPMFWSGSISGQDSIYLTITDPATGCNASKAKAITVMPLPFVAPITGPDSFCFYDVIQLRDSTPGGTWLSGSSYFNVTSGGIVSAVNPGAAWIRYSVASPFGCIDSKYRVVTALPRPEIDPITGPDILCLSDATASLMSTTSGGSWYSADTSLAIINSAGNITPVKGGSVMFYYRYADTHGCYDSTTKLIDIVDTVNATVIQNGGTLLAEQSGASYVWLDCAAGYLPIPGETSQAFHPARGGRYAVAVSIGTCTDTSTCIDFGSTGVEAAVNGGKGVSLFPNPASGSVTIQINVAMKDATILLMDINGKILQRVVTARQKTLLHTADYSEGIYPVRIVTGGQTYHRRLVIQR